jgi:glycosyltransferase involved in cell wall biosynthesis
MMPFVPASTPSGEKQQTLRGKEIVCVGFAEWEAELPTNQHHLMSRLAETNRILFIESLGLRRPQFALRDVRRLWRRLRAGLRGLRQEDGVHVLSPLALPVYGNRVARFLNRSLLRWQVQNAVDRLGLQRPILWGYVPHAEVLIDLLDPSLVVYHCVDDLAAQKGVDANNFREVEHRFVGHADLVLASAPSLSERLRRISDHVVDAPNVADVDFFATALDEGPVDDAIGRLTPPRVVFVGAIVATKLDMELLAKLAELRREWSFALVGPIGAGDPRTDVSVLRRQPNIHLLGARPYHELPDVLRAADAALIPYAVNPLTASVFPMKVYEYLAVGLPVVATPLPALAGVDGVTIAADAESAAAALERLMAEDTPERRRRQSLSASGHSWTARLAEIAAAVDAVSPPEHPHWSVDDLVVDLHDV